MLAVLRQKGDSFDYTATADIAVNELVDLTTRVGVALSVIPTGSTGAVALVGIYEATATTATEFLVGSQAYFDGTEFTNVNTDTPAGMVIVGKAAAVAGTIEVRIG